MKNWKLYIYGDGTPIVGEEGSGAKIAHMADGWPKADILAHARLIAQAPALLAALEALAEWPRRSATVDGQLSGDAQVGLANVRRFARAAIRAAS